MILRYQLAGVLGLVCAIAPACQPLSQLGSPSYDAQLADHLASTGAKMYGAYWCPHCARQKQLFGNAAPLLPYVECDPRGTNAKVELCNTVGISAYPTWQINGEFHLGVQSLQRLAMLSGFENANGQASENYGEGGFSPVP